MENKRFYKRCVIGEGWFNTPVIACVDDLGNRIPNGTIFPTIDFLYFQRSSNDFSAYLTPYYDPLTLDAS